MTMHLLPAYFTTTNSKKRKVKRKSSPKHDAFLLKMGCHPKQIKEKKKLDNNWASEYNAKMKVGQKEYVSAGMSGNASSCTKRGIMTNLHKETDEVRQEILNKASRIQPLYNKGGLQYVTDGTDLHDVGKKK